MDTNIENNEPINNQQAPENTGADNKADKKSTLTNDKNPEPTTGEQTNDKDEKKHKKKKEKPKTELELKTEELEAMGYKLSEINDKYLRLSAEFDNYRKRILKEKTDLIKTAGGTTLADMLPVIDDLERALVSIDKATEISAVKEGVTLIYNKFKDFMKSKGLNEIDAISKEFDTDFHEAITKIPAPTTELKGKVVDVIQKGYIIDEKVIRFAKVVVGE